MQRKRYKKLLMSVGYGRNSAEQMCGRVVRRKSSYAEEWALIKPVVVPLHKCGISVKRLIKEMGFLSKALGKFVISVDTAEVENYESDC